jgi:hypothetical protein
MSTGSQLFVGSGGRRLGDGLPAEEVSGVYGPLRLSEKILHQIWQTQQIRLSHLKTRDGRALEVVFPGYPNPHAGPDFLNAEIRIGGEWIRGDVEIDFYPEYWFVHRHHESPAFKNVILHVVLFDSRSGRSSEDVSLHSMPILELVTYLNKDLESYAYEYALLSLEGRSSFAMLDAFLNMERSSQLDYLQEKSSARWTQKCNFAKKRLDEHGWMETCHQYFLEVLGYSQNRSVMSALALQYPYEKLLRMDWMPEELYDAFKSQWKNRGVRPPNRPLMRLRQYHQLLRKSPRWPYEMQLFAEQFAANMRTSKFTDIQADTVQVRREHQFKALREEMSEDILASIISTSRLDNWFVDAFLPLAAVFTGENLFAYWYHWYDADAPNFLKSWVTGLNLATVSNGLIQGSLQLIIA